MHPGKPWFPISRPFVITAIIPQSGPPDVCFPFPPKSQVSCDTNMSFPSLRQAETYGIPHGACQKQPPMASLWFPPGSAHCICHLLYSCMAAMQGCNGEREGFMTRSVLTGCRTWGLVKRRRFPFSSETHRSQKREVIFKSAERSPSFPSKSCLPPVVCELSFRVLPASYMEHRL